MGLSDRQAIVLFACVSSLDPISAREHEQEWMDFDPNSMALQAFLAFSKRLVGV
jgi:hypothetical protein